MSKQTEKTKAELLEEIRQLKERLEAPAELAAPGPVQAFAVCTNCGHRTEVAVGGTLPTRCMVCGGSHRVEALRLEVE